ncbi:MAG: AMP-binding protein [Acidimicrobiia bacterium]
MALHEILDGAAAAHPDAPALRFEDAARTFAELRQRVANLAAALAELFRPGERIAILAENCPAYVECLYGVPAARGALVLLNYRLHPDEWVAQLRSTGAAMLIGERAFLDELGARLRALPELRFVVPIDASEAGELPYEQLLAGSTTRAADPAGASTPVARNAAWIIFTSGTTGVPKGAVLTHESLTAALDVMQDRRPVRDDEVYLFPFPLCHVSAYNVLLLHRAVRPVVLARRFTTVGVAGLIEQHRVTAVSLAPTMLAMLLDDPVVADHDLSSLRSIGYGASAIPVPVLRRAAERFGCELSQGYGMTELSGNAVFLDAADHRRGLAGDGALLASAGRPRPPVEVRIDDDTRGAGPRRDARNDTVGEILVRAPQVMRGYWHDDDATAAALEDGWLRTGDVGRLDADGYLYVVDRKKDVIITGGENVSSREVEQVLHEFPGVRDVAVIGLPDEQWGEVVTAVVVEESGITIDRAALSAFAGSRLAGFKKPRRVEIVDALPVNAAGKVLKARLRAELA